MPLPANDRPVASTTLCWLHGFTQTGRSAHRFRSILAARGEVLAPDLARHGERWDQGGSLDDIADAVVAQWPAGVVDLGGYSMGARVALHVALRHRDRVRRVVLIGATRGIADESARAQRRQRDEGVAQRIEQLGADAFVDEWLTQPMFVDLPADDRERDARRAQHASSLAQSLREAGTGTQRWLGEEIARLTHPTLALAGAYDTRFAREAEAIARTVAVGSFALIPGAGHAAHLAQPLWCAKVVANFLDESMNEVAPKDEDHPES